MSQTVLFYLISTGVVLASIGVVASRSAVYSVLFLVAALCLTAGLFTLLKAFLVATILVLVYAGAILVLFLFVVMMTPSPVSPTHVGRSATGGSLQTGDGVIPFKKNGGLKISPVLALVLGVAIFLEVAFVIRSIHLAPAAPVHGTAQAVGSLLFTRYLLPFELTSFLLLAAVVSVVVLAKKDAS